MKFSPIKALFFILLTGILLSCNDNSTKPVANKSVLNDSIAAWLVKDKKDSPLKHKENINKAYKKLKEEKNDSLTRKYLNKVSYQYLKNKHFPEFRDANNYLILLSNQAKDSVRLAFTYWDLGYYHQIQAKLDSCYYYYLSTQKIYKSIRNVKSEGVVWTNLANVQSKAKDYKGSEISSTNALTLLKGLPDTERAIYDSYNNLGSVSNSMKKHDQALEYYNKALEYQKKILPKNTLDLYVLNNIGNVFREKKEHSKAIDKYNQVLATDSLYHKKTSFYAKVLNNLGYDRFLNGETKNVENQLQRSLQIWDSLQNLSGIAIGNYNLAEYYLAKQDSSKALEYAKKSEEYAKQSKNNKRLLQSYNLLASLDSKTALEYAKKYIALNDSLLQEERNLQDKFALIKFETDEVIDENKALEEDNQFLTSLAMVAFLAILIFSIIVAQYNKNQKLKFEKAQQESNLETFNLMLSQKENLALAKQEEQQRISQELHDGAVPELSGIRMILQATNNSADKIAIAERSKVITQLQETAEEIRSISHELNAASSKKIQNFTFSLQELLDNTQKASGIDAKFNFDESIDWDALSANVKINLYRIIQEAVQNCVKHAKAKNISLDLSGDESNLFVTLTDNGIGFNTKKRKKGIGQKNILSRVKKINAALNVTSKIKSGTKIIITIPVSSIAS